MNVIKEDFDIRNDCWSGAADRIADLTDHQIDVLEQNLEDVFYGETPTETEVNDFIWFEDGTWLDWLGFNSYDEMLYCNEHDCTDNYYIDGSEAKSDDELMEEFEELDPEDKEDYADWEEWAEDMGWEILDAVF